MSDCWSDPSSTSILYCVNSESSGKTAQMHRLSWAIAGCLCDKYHNLRSWLKCFCLLLKNVLPVSGFYHLMITILETDKLGGLQQKYDMSLITRKPVFGVWDHVRLKPACSATERASFEILDIETRDIILSKKRITKVWIRLRECAGWFACLLFAYGKYRFCHDVAHLPIKLL